MLGIHKLVFIESMHHPPKLYAQVCTCMYMLFHPPAPGKSLGFIRPKERLRLPWLLSGEQSAFNAGDVGDLVSIPELGRSPGGGQRNLLQYSFLENPTGRGAWRAAGHRAVKSGTPLKRLNTHTHTHTHTQRELHYTLQIETH